MKDPIVWRLIRWLYGAYFVCLGVSSVLELIGVLPEPHWDWRRGCSDGSRATLTLRETSVYTVCYQINPQRP
jgi:hypothetical protein